MLNYVIIAIIIININGAGEEEGRARRQKWAGVTEWMELPFSAEQ